MPAEAKNETGYPIAWRVPEQKFRRSFSSREEIEAFLEDELAFWQSLKEQLQSVPVNSPLVVDWGNKPFADARHAIRQSTADAEEILTSLEEMGAILSEGAQGLHLADLISREPSLAPGFIVAARSSLGAASTPPAVPQPRNFNPLPIMTAGFGSVLDFVEQELAGRAPRQRLEKEQADAQELRDAVATSKNEFDTWKQSHEAAAQEALEQFQQDSKGAIETAQNELDGALKQSNEKINELERKVMVDLVVQAPTSYWNSKARNHHVVAGAFGLVFVGVVGAGLWWMMGGGAAGFLADVTARMAANRTSAPGLEAYFLPLAFLSIPALAVAWFLRHVSRVIVQSMALAADAELRGTIATTFRALTSERTPGDAEVTMMLQALFRPLDSSGHVEVAPPTLKDILDQGSAGGQQ